MAISSPYCHTATGLYAATVNNVSSTTNIAVGRAVSGAGIHAGRQRCRYSPTSSPASSAGTINLTIPATANALGVTLTFGSNVEGMVPITSLHLPQDYAIDGWGNRIMYAVDARFTASGAMTPYPAAISMYGYINNTSMATSI